MQIKVVANLGRGFPPFKNGEVHDVEEELAAKLIDMGLAVRCAIRAVPPPPAIEAVPPPPQEGSVEKATEDLIAYREKQKRKPKDAPVES